MNYYMNSMKRACAQARTHARTHYVQTVHAVIPPWPYYMLHLNHQLFVCRTVFRRKYKKDIYYEWILKCVLKADTDCLPQQGHPHYVFMVFMQRR